jgi:glycopeptide antibiotics resistance protein
VWQGGANVKELEMYINRVLNELSVTKKERQELYDELYDHISSLYMEHLRNGLDEKGAARAAIEEFGEGEFIGKELNKSIFPVERYAKIIGWTLFVPYVLCMIYLLFIYNRSANGWVSLPENIDFQVVSHYINLVPFGTIYTYISGFNNYNFDTWIMNMAGNVIVFITLGMLLPLLFKKCMDMKDLCVICVKGLFIVEVLQLVTFRGIFDIDDIILNMVGVLIGFAMWSMVKRFTPLKRIRT